MPLVTLLGVAAAAAARAPLPPPMNGGTYKIANAGDTIKNPARYWTILY